MRQYFIRRALLIVPTVLGVTLLITLLLQILQGNIADLIFAESATFNQELTKEQIEDDLGINEELFGSRFLGIFKQWGEWLGGVVQGDFGEYFRSRRSVGGELADRIPVTLELSLLALVFSLLIALPTGIISAIRQDTMVDHTARSFSIFMLALPSFWLGTMYFVIVGNWDDWGLPSSVGDWLLPPTPYKDIWEDPMANIRQMWAPAFILGFALAGSVMRLTRSQMLEVLRQDYVRTAWSKGLRERTVVFRHAIKNAFIPVLSLIGVQIAILISGSVVLESIFALPGLGLMLIESVRQREFVAVQGLILVVAAFVVLVNFLVDMVYSLLDPRIRYS
jgi:peptide/nickel transport system permease protein